MKEKTVRVFVWRYAETQNFAISKDKISHPVLHHPPNRWGNVQVCFLVWLFTPPVGYFLIYPTTWISRQKTRLVAVHA